MSTWAAFWLVAAILVIGLFIVFAIHDLTYQIISVRWELSELNAAFDEFLDDGEIQNQNDPLDDFCNNSDY